MFFDSHVHFDSVDGDYGFPLQVTRSIDAGTARMTAIGGTHEMNMMALRAARAHPGIVTAAVGLDRDFAERWETDRPYVDDAIRRLDEDASRTECGVVAIGETGLDYHYSADTAAAQRGLLSRHLEWARERELPVVIHSREADEDTISMLREHAAAWQGSPDELGVLHCFTGNQAFAEQLVALGYYISFSGIVTFRNADPLRDVARHVPAERLLIETDAPYLAPVPHRGKRNEPAFVRHVAECLAEVRGESLDAVATATFGNACRLFGLTDPA